MKLVGTFIKNTDKIISEILDERIIFITNSYVIFEGDIKESHPFLNSVFILFKRFNRKDYGASKITNWTQNSPNFTPRMKETKKIYGAKKLRIMYIKNNQTIPLSKELYDVLSSAIVESGINVVNQNQTHDLWLYLHEETKTGWLGLKIIGHQDFHTEERKGTLRPQIAYMMNCLSNPALNDRVIDPFAGSGELMSIRAKYFEGVEFVSVDIDKNISPNDKRHIAIRTDFFNVNYVNYFDTIVTDPPWGNFDKSMDVNTFYEKMIEKFKDVLKPNGKVVLLVSRESSSLLETKLNPYFEINQKHKLKVWGMPANIYVLHQVPTENNSALRIK